MEITSMYTFLDQVVLAILLALFTITLLLAFLLAANALCARVQRLKKRCKDT